MRPPIKRIVTIILLDNETGIARAAQAVLAQDAEYKFRTNPLKKAVWSLAADLVDALPVEDIKPEPGATCEYFVPSDKQPQSFSEAANKAIGNVPIEPCGKPANVVIDISGWSHDEEPSPMCRYHAALWTWEHSKPSPNRITLEDEPIIQVEES